MFFFVYCLLVPFIHVTTKEKQEDSTSEHAFEKVNKIKISKSFRKKQYVKISCEKAVDFNFIRLQMSKYEFKARSKKYIPL